jgi:1-acyl-sn-glycerol-3-phosphate acyltransferase
MSKIIVLTKTAPALTGAPSFARSSPVPPKIKDHWVRWFTWYSRRYLRRHFHTLRVSRNGLPSDNREWPIVLYSNHASWWDPLVFLLLKAEFFPARKAYAPIDAKMLARYPFFKHLGFLGVEPHSHRGLKQFLLAAQLLMESADHMLAITPQGRFADARERPPEFKSGLGHLAARVPRALFIPMAVEYVFWEERLPEILIRFGEPVRVTSWHQTAFSPAYWTALLQDKLAETQDALALETQRRSPDDFQRVIHGGAGQGGVYDLWRWLKAKYRGETFQKEHGAR